MGGRAHLRVDHSQPPDEPRLRVLGTDHGGTCLLVDDPINAQKAGQRNRMRASQTPSRVALYNRGVVGTYDAVVVGSGPNGLAAAIELARNERRVAVLEGRSTLGGGTRSAEITLPGFVHDLGSAIHPLGYASPFFRSLPLREHGL